MIGDIFAFGGSIVPEGFLECNGAALSRTTFANLFSVIGTNWGHGDNSATFNIPDLRGIFIRGRSHSSSKDPDRLSRTASLPGGSTGDNVGSYQNDSFKSHKHSLADASGISSILVNSGSDIQVASYRTTRNTLISAPPSSVSPFETRPSNVYVMFIIKY